MANSTNTCYSLAMLPLKKRSRATKVCDFCKRRKVRCDLGKPCSACTKYGNPNCQYSDINGDVGVEEGEEEEDLSEIVTKSQLQLLKDKIKCLEQSVNAFKPGNSNGNSANLAGGASYGIHENSKESIVESHKITAAAGLGSSVSSGSINPPSPRTVIPPIGQNNGDWSHLLGFNPVASVHDTISFYEGYTPIYDKEPIRRRNFGPLSWLSLIHVDNAMKNLWRFIHCNKSMKLKAIAFAANPDSSEVERAFSKKVTVHEGLAETRSFVEKPPTKTEIKDNISKKGASLGLLFYEGELDGEMELLEKIRVVLPKRKVLWALYQRFFTDVYPFFPFVDEVILKVQIQNLIGVAAYDEEKISIIKVLRKLDFAHLGTLLIILRFSYLSLFTNIVSVNEANYYSEDPSPKAQEKRYLLNNPINIDVIEVSQLCLDQFNLMRSGNMSIMQLALFSRVYHQYAPEDGDGTDGGDALVFNSILIHMAYSLGLHREPDNFTDQCNDEKVNHIGRKIWYYLLILDLNNSMSLGTLPSTNKNGFDTKLPFYKPGNENVVDVEMERTTVSAFQHFGHIYDQLNDLMTLILNLRCKVKMSELTEKMDNLETHFVKDFEKLKNLMKSDVTTYHDTFYKTLRMKIYYSSNFFLVSIYFHFFNYYERRQNSELAFYYLKKVFVITIHDLMPFYFEFLEKSHMLFKNSSDIIVTPSFELACHKSMLVLTSIFIRLQLAIINYETKFDHSSRMIKELDYRTHFNKVTKFKSLVDSCLKVFREHLQRLSYRYYYAWRITKAQGYFWSVLNDRKFYDSIPRGSNEFKIHFDDDMLGELIDIFETALAKVKEHKKSKLREERKKAERGAEPSNHINESYHHLNGKVKLEQQATTNNTPRMSASSLTSDVPVSIPTNYSATSVSSNSSDNLLDQEYFPNNNQIDRIWLQMMTLRKDSEPNARTNDQSGNISYPSAYNPFAGDIIFTRSFNTPGDNGTPSMANILNPTDPIPNNINGVEYGINNYNPMNDASFIESSNIDNAFLDLLPIEELFKDISG